MLMLYRSIALAGVVALVGHIAPAAAQSQSQTFSCTGSPESFTVPTGVNQLQVEAHGGQGQARGGSQRAGYGGSVIATVPVTASEVLSIYVGCHSDEGQGFGWGIGGDHGHADGAEAEDGGFGGGGSAVLRSGQTELVVAGGGGGDGGDGGVGGTGGQGGAGGNGGIDPQPGGQGCTADGCPNAGGSSGGGKGGCAACASTIAGESGTHSSTFDDGGGGGGGGGGHAGGGGGHGGSGFAGVGNGGGGGGGGSSYVIASATNVSHGTDTSGGDGIVILSWTVSGSATFTCSDGATTFTVPDGVTQVSFEVRGAAGAPGRNGGGFVTGHGGAGGLGGMVTATMPVTGGQQFTIQAGCADANGYRQGGGGGPGGSTGSGGNGGGLSAVYATAYYIMAGGGGGGGGAGLSGDGGAGGDAGNPATNGQPGTDGGAVGGCSNGEAGCGSSSNTDPNGSGDPGQPGSDVSAGGGGGGAGWPYGGGGGGGDAGKNLGGGGGGGGGQSFAGSPATNVSFGAASGGGDGVVIIRWGDDASPAPQAPVPLAPVDGKPQSEARAINSWGQIAGFSTDGKPIATTWDQHGSAHALPPLEGDSASQAFAINDWGEIAGDSAGATTSAVRWHRHAPPLRLAPPEGDRDSFARGINRRGEVAGWSARRDDADSDGTVLQAVRWSADGTPSVLMPLDGDLEAIALAINDRGLVAGYSFSPGDPARDRAVVWNQHGEPTALSETDSEAAAINRRGLVAGDSESGLEAATLWPVGGAPRSLDPLDADLDADLEGQAFAINRRGTAAGVSRSDRNSAVIWPQGGRPLALAPLPGHQESWAWGLNDRGDVVGFSAGESGTTAVLWPAPRRHRHHR